MSEGVHNPKTATETSEPTMVSYEPILVEQIEAQKRFMQLLEWPLILAKKATLDWQKARNEMLDLEKLSKQLQEALNYYPIQVEDLDLAQCASESIRSEALLSIRDEGRTNSRDAIETFREYSEILGRIYKERSRIKALFILATSKLEKVERAYADAQNSLRNSQEKCQERVAYIQSAVRNALESLGLRFLLPTDYQQEVMAAVREIVDRGCSDIHLNSLQEAISRSLIKPTPVPTQEPLNLSKKTGIQTVVIENFFRDNESKQLEAMEQLSSDDGLKYQDLREIMRIRNMIIKVARHPVTQKILAYMMYLVYGDKPYVLKRIVVHPSFRRKYIGSQLILDLIQKCSDRGKNLQVAMDRPDTYAMQKFLHAHGFLPSSNSTESSPLWHFMTQQESVRPPTIITTEPDRKDGDGESNGVLTPK